MWSRGRVFLAVSPRELFLHRIMASSSSSGVADAQRAALLATPSPEAERAYYAALSAAAAKSGAGDVRVRRVAHGKGLVAARSFKKGERVLVEAPLVGMQAETNRADAQVCGFCFRWVGTVESQIARRLLRGDMSSTCERNGVCKEFLENLRDGTTRLPLSNEAQFKLPEISKNEGGEVFCGVECANQSWARHGKLLRGSEGKDFLEHARDTNDIFILSAKVLLTVAGQALAWVPGDDEAAGEGADISKQHSPPAPDGTAATQQALLKAWEPFHHGHKQIWWEAVARPTDVASGAAELEFRDSMREIATESLNLLKKALPTQFLSRLPGLFTLEVFASVVGMFELNNLEIAVASPVEDYFLMIDELGDTQITAITNPLLDALDTGYCTPCEGSGFFALQSCLNSDCDPNVAPTKDDCDVDGKCVLVAKRDINENEELTMCYVDETKDVQTRRGELRDYGFECQCETCVAQAEGRGTVRRGSKTK